LRSFPGLRVLDRFILRELCGPFLLGVFIFTMILVTGDVLFQAAMLVIERGVSLSVVLRLFAYRLPELVTLTLPMSCLLSTLLGMTRLASNNELIALKSLGVSYYRMLRPVALASFVISAGALAFNETVVPFAVEAADNLMRYEILKNQASALQEKVFLRDGNGGALRRVLYLETLDAENGLMSGVLVNDFDNGRLARTSLARRGLWRDGEWWLEDGQVFEVSEKGDVRLLLRFDRQKLALTLTPGQLQRRTKRPMDMSALELWGYMDQARMEGNSLRQVMVLFHLRLAVPWACVILALLGTSFGASQRGRAGSGLAFFISLLIVFAYYVLMSLCRALGEAGNLAPVLAAWTPNILFLVVGIYFSRRVN
jgi:lipopolysaccharide export system permease protein